jgi:hypothetical protein
MLISTSIGIKFVHLGSRNSRIQELESELENEMSFFIFGALVLSGGPRFPQLRATRMKTLEMIVAYLASRLSFPLPY